MLQNLLFVLLEADEVKMEVFYAILFEQVLSNQTTQVYARLRQRIVLVERGVTLDCTEATPVIAHV